ncbi:hypothetical protein KSF_108830 [Reticulibacter mediterranei]|uniref:Uncharacterized protein n=1 Tax=Reticulibacter mediterranei TaxID=2778369 RepID=A0A8J3IYI8_9CHLR|nr:hypothetical protein [Reticulibacter mediterranei]GHP00836.1 hypothetical protein KSF_108830 [Reticulibacter mediterranei]
MRFSRASDTQRKSARLFWEKRGDPPFNVVQLLRKMWCLVLPCELSSMRVLVRTDGGHDEVNPFSLPAS